MSQRIFDIVFAVIGVIVFSPLWALMAITIWINDRGTILFKQERLGKDFKPFGIYKFRTMKDEQVTKPGQWIRKTGLDESLQFINVLKGEMSLVGPRPITEKDRQKLNWDKPWLDWRWRVKPGITGFAQIYEPLANKKSLAKDRWSMIHSKTILHVRWLLLTFSINLFGKDMIRRYKKGI